SRWLFRLFSSNCALIRGASPRRFPARAANRITMITQADDTTPVAAGTVRARIGIRGRLFAAFTIIAGLAVALAALAILSFTELGGVLEQITSERLPPITAALQLARVSESLVALGPAIAGADDGDQLA